MAGTATKSEAKLKAKLRADAEKLLALNIKHRKLFEEIDGIESELKTTATDLGGSFKEEFAGKGAVSISGRRDKTFKGNVPEVDETVFNALSDAKKAVLVAAGIVKVVSAYSAANYGRVSVKLFAAA